MLRWDDNRQQPGLRSFVGLLFTVGGILGFLPVVGFWMLPLGLAIIALDIPPMRQRIHRWMVKLHATAFPGDAPYRPTSSQ